MPWPDCDTAAAIVVGPKKVGTSAQENRLRTNALPARRIVNLNYKAQQWTRQCTQHQILAQNRVQLTEPKYEDKSGQIVAVAVSFTTTLVCLHSQSGNDTNLPSLINISLHKTMGYPNKKVCSAWPSECSRVQIYLDVLV